jgi:hypothetical protein
MSRAAKEKKLNDRENTAKGEHSEGKEELRRDLLARRRTWKERRRRHQTEKREQARRRRKSEEVSRAAKKERGQGGIILIGRARRRRKDGGEFEGIYIQRAKQRLIKSRREESGERKAKRRAATYRVINKVTRSTQCIKFY